MFKRALPVIAAMMLVACGGSSDTDVASVDVAPAPTAAPESPSASDGSSGSDTSSEVPNALQLTAPLVGGGEIELGAYAGRPVLLWFWAPW